MTLNGFGYSFDQERWFGPFPTRDAALDEARADEPDATAVYLCQCEPETFERALLAAIDADAIVEDADERSSEVCDSGHEDAVFDQSSGAIWDLQQRLSDAARAWLKEHPCRSWFSPRHIEMVTIGGPDGRPC